MVFHTELEKTFATHDEQAFPKNVDYVRRYENVVEELEPIHNEATIGAFLADMRDRTSPHQLGVLTHHGVDHVSGVVLQLANLLHTSDNEDLGLTPYEMYILLFAAQLHDAGVLLGRKNHATHSTEIITRLSSTAAHDSTEKAMVAEVAAAHCASPLLGLDTISHLPARHRLIGEHVRPQFLAALLRFADELADDCSRVSVLLPMDLLPNVSEIYHVYANCLDPVTIDGHDVQLTFTVDPRYATNKCGKGDSQVFLLDEIRERTLKMHRERLYCDRFLIRHGVRVDCISVNVSLRQKDSLAVLKELDYRLEKTGYPEPPSMEDVCPDFRWTGQTLCDEITSRLEPR